MKLSKRKNPIALLHRAQSDRFALCNKDLLTISLKALLDRLRWVLVVME